VEAEGATGDQPDLGVDRFDPGVGEAMLDRGLDPVALVGDCPRELDEPSEAAAARRCKPAIQEPDRGGGEAVDLPELLLST
jgi:hypothetical protein